MPINLSPKFVLSIFGGILMFGVNIYYKGSIDKLNIQDALETSIYAAFEWLDQYVVLRGIIDVQINIDETSTGRFSGTGPTHNHLGSINASIHGKVILFQSLVQVSM